MQEIEINNHQDVARRMQQINDRMAQASQQLAEQQKMTMRGAQLVTSAQALQTNMTQTHSWKHLQISREDVEVKFEGPKEPSLKDYLELLKNR